MTKTEQAYQDKIAWAMSTIKERDGYCLVASQSEAMPHVVTVNENLYSQDCTCKAGHDGLDCYHRIAVDRHYDDRRPSFHERLRQHEAKASQAARDADRTAYLYYEMSLGL